MRDELGNVREIKSNSIMVSVVCVTYNHKSCLAEAIESVLMQNTDFKYELIIHDDASTDGTTSIIQEYVEKYPDIIVPIYQKENQYSKGIKATVFFVPKVKGKYIAFCEGDDYWTDTSKLQTQVDIMEQNPSYSMCTHASEKVNTRGEALGVIGDLKEDAVYNAVDIISSEITMFHTSSYLFKTEFAQNLPFYYYSAPVGDYPLRIYLSTRGDIYHISKVMAVYRLGIESSWSTTKRKDKKAIAVFLEELIKMFDDIDEATNYKYNTQIKVRKTALEYNVHYNRNDLFRMQENRFKEHYRKLKFKTKVLIFAKRYLPFITNSYYKFKFIIKHNNCF